MNFYDIRYTKLMHVCVYVCVGGGHTHLYGIEFSLKHVLLTSQLTFLEGFYCRVYNTRELTS